MLAHRPWLRHCKKQRWACAVACVGRVTVDLRLHRPRRKCEQVASAAAASAKRRRATKLWTEIQPLLEHGGKEAVQAVEAFVADWKSTEIVQSHC